MYGDESMHIKIDCRGDSQLEYKQRKGERYNANTLVADHWGKA